MFDISGETSTLASWILHTVIMYFAPFFFSYVLQLESGQVIAVNTHFVRTLLIQVYLTESRFNPAASAVQPQTWLGVISFDCRLNGSGGGLK